MTMEKQITWEMILQDLKQRLPKLGRSVRLWFPSDRLTIDVWLDDGMFFRYDYEIHTGYFIGREDLSSNARAKVEETEKRIQQKMMEVRY